MTQPQLKIRIRLDQPVTPLAESTQSADVTPPEPPVYEYHWDRIVAAVLILLLTLIALFKIGSLLLEENEVTDTVIVAPVADVPRLPTMDAAPQSTGDEQQHETAAADLSSDTEAMDESADSETLEEIATAAISVPENTESGSFVQTESDIAAVLPSAKLDMPVHPAAKPLAATVEQVQPKPAVRHASSVVRAQLTSNIRGHEPVDSIDRVALDGRASRPIFLFLHLRGLRGDKITFNWFYQDKHVARVVLPVGNNDWRTYSSKVLNKNRLGAWRVTATNSTGKLLAEAGFTAVR